MTSNDSDQPEDDPSDERMLYNHLSPSHQLMFKSIKLVSLLKRSVVSSLIGFSSIVWMTFSGPGNKAMGPFLLI